jgi:hypothetical protein
MSNAVNSAVQSAAITSQEDEYIVVVDNTEDFAQFDESLFCTAMDAEEAVKRVGEALGFEIYSHFRNKNSGIITSGKLYCEFGRKPSTGVSFSEKTDCKFHMFYRWNADVGQYGIELRNCTHNHPIILRETGVTGLPEALKWRIREM